MDETRAARPPLRGCALGSATFTLVRAHLRAAPGGRSGPGGVAVRGWLRVGGAGEGSRLSTLNRAGGRRGHSLQVANPWRASARRQGHSRSSMTPPEAKYEESTRSQSPLRVMAAIAATSSAMRGSE